MIDGIWGYICEIKSSVTEELKFPRLGAVAVLVLCLPHSNADAERVFSQIGLNKTGTRNQLSLEGTLSSIMTIKMAEHSSCHQFDPPMDVVKQSKLAASEYNRSHPPK